MASVLDSATTIAHPVQLVTVHLLDRRSRSYRIDRGDACRFRTGQDDDMDEDSPPP
jgi:hypothetical protein